jgi:hypothetical protein
MRRFFYLWTGGSNVRFNRTYMIMAVTVLLLSTGFGAAALADTPNVKEGLWEITVKMEMPGMPMEMPEVKHTQCITEDNAVPDTSQPGQQCKVISRSIAGDTVTWKMECDTPQGSVHSEGSITYHGDTFEGTASVTTEQMVMTQEMKGRRVGDCK